MSWELFNGNHKAYLTTDIAHLSEFDFRYNAHKVTGSCELIAFRPLPVKLSPLFASRRVLGRVDFFTPSRCGTCYHGPARSLSRGNRS